tara:strand:+ start:31 stop:642 length:612 start_codon:yes stop_codon:yes gene_type:complete
MNFIEDLKVTGHLQIAKVHDNGDEEIVYDDHNVIVSGMSVGLSYLFSLSGSSRATDFQLDRFQLGVSGPPKGGSTSSIFQLSGALSSLAEYGGDSAGLTLVSATQIKNGLTNTEEAFALIPFSNMTRIDDTSIRYSLIIDKDSCNNISRLGPSTAGALNEVGLFMKNPRGLAATQSILVAYRQFTDIVKTSDFALIFRWTLNF